MSSLNCETILQEYEMSFEDKFKAIWQQGTEDGFERWLVRNDLTDSLQRLFNFR